MSTVPRIRLAPDYTISRLLKGGWQLARGHGSFEPDDALSDMDRFVDAGITTFDCADIYTGVEALIGGWLKRRAHRGGVTPVQIHTKYVPDLDRLGTHSRADVERGVERSLGRLGIDRLDLVQLHWWDYTIAGYLDAVAWLDEMRRAGKVRHVGVTNFDRRHLAEIVAAGIPLVSHQVQYSVLDRRPATMSTFAAENNIALLCYGALAGGFLSNRYLGQEDPAARLENRSLAKYRLIIDEFGGWERFQRLLQALATVAARHEVGIGTIAIRWVLEQPGVAGVIVGARHAAHLDAIVRAAAIELADEDRAEIARAQEQTGPHGEVYALERVKGGPHAAIMRYSLNRDA